MSEVVQLVPHIPATPEAREVVRRLSIPQLKRVWDRWADDGGAANTWEADPGCFIAEAVHAEMSERGEGSYVAI